MLQLLELTLTSGLNASHLFLSLLWDDVGLDGCLGIYLLAFLSFSELAKAK